MFTVNVQIGLTQSTEEMLKQLLSHLNRIESLQSQRDAIAAAPLTQLPAAPAAPQQTVQEAPISKAESVQDGGKKERVTLEVIRKKAMELSQSNEETKAKLKSLLAEFDAKKLTEVKESDYEAFNEKLQQL